MPRGKRVRSGEKTNVYNYFEQQSKKQKVATPLKYGQKTAEATGFARRTVDKVVREKRGLEGGAEFSSPAKRYKESRVRIDVDSFDVDAIHRTVHKFYEQKVYPTLDSLLQVLKEKDLVEDEYLCGSFC